MSLLSNAFGKSKGKSEFAVKGYEVVKNYTMEEWKSEWEATFHPDNKGDFSLHGGGVVSASYLRLTGFVNQFGMSAGLKAYYEKVKDYARTFDYNKRRSSLIVPLLTHDEIYPQHVMAFYYLSGSKNDIRDICENADLADYEFVKTELERCHELGIINALAKEFEKYSKKEFGFPYYFKRKRESMYDGNVWNL